MDLEEAISLAATAHRGQVDKLGEPYILHPLRVMNSFKDTRHRIVGVLHDTLEDTFVTEDLLLEMGLEAEMVGAIYALSRQDGESYRDFIDRVLLNPMARNVKIADIRDNLLPSRAPKNPTNDDIRRVVKYREALSLLLEGIAS